MRPGGSATASRFRRRGRRSLPRSRARARGTTSTSESAAALLRGDRPARVVRVLGRVDVAAGEAVDGQRRVRVLCVLAVVEVEEERHRSRGLHRGNCKTAAVDVFDQITAEAEAESPLWAAALRPDEPSASRIAVFSPLAPGGLRARARDRLRGLPRPLRRPEALRLGRGERAGAPRRLPLRARPRPDRCRRRRRRRRGDGRADLPLRLAPRGRRDAATARPGSPRRGRSAASRPATRSRPRSGSTSLWIDARVGGYDPAVIFDAASDGLHIIVGMLIVGLVFLAVIGLGELAKAVSHRRKARRPSSY